VLRSVVLANVVSLLLVQDDPFQVFISFPAADDISIHISPVLLAVGAESDTNVVFFVARPVFNVEADTYAPSTV